MSRIGLPQPSLPHRQTRGGVVAAARESALLVVRWNVPLLAGLLAVLLVAGPADAGSRWVWPLSPHRVIRGFDPPQRDWLPGHRGADVAGSAGDPVRAAAAGVVRFAGPLAGKGVVVIGHGRLRSTYEPVRPSVRVGQRVAAGQVIGVLAPGESHCISHGEVTCLHWGLRRGRRYLDPLAAVAGHPRLLPLLH